MTAQQDNGSAPARRTAGAFDVRFIIGGLLAVYGLVLVIVAAVSADGRSINLWSGIGMLAAALVFGAWARFVRSSFRRTSRRTRSRPSTEGSAVSAG